MPGIVVREESLPEDTRPRAVPVKPVEERSPEGKPVLTSGDVREINARLAYLDKHFGGLRVHVAEYRIPWPLTKSHYEQYRKEAVDKWLKIMELKGWELRSKVHVKGIRPAYGLYGKGHETVALLDQRAVRVLAAFQAKKTEPVKIEVPVTQEPYEDTIARYKGLVNATEPA